MIPLRYRLRQGVRLEAAGDGSWRVVSGVPLSALRVNAAAARLLELARGGVSVGDLAAALSLPEERCLQLCDGFRRRGILDVSAAPAADAPLPSVTVVVPTKDRAGELAECLAALARLDYPKDRLAVIVVDDGSADPEAVARVAAAHGAGCIVNERNLGPAGARNRAAREATSELLAFVDSDCVADAGWLRALAPYFVWERVGAVAGRTLGYYRESRLARYEEVSSPLDMGARLLFEAEGPNSLYAPTCNLLVRRSVFAELGGLREELRLGEDVDFCWRLRESGRVLLYAPEGVVRHKHLDRLPAMLRRRADYGSSEARLHALHPDKRGRLRLPPASAATVALASAGIVTRRPWLWRPRWRRRSGMPPAAPAVCAGAGRRCRPRRSCSRRCAATSRRCTSPTSGWCATTSGRWLPRASSCPACGCWRPRRCCTRPASTTRRAGRASASRRISASTSPSTRRIRRGCTRVTSAAVAALRLRRRAAPAVPVRRPALAPPEPGMRT